MGVNFTARPSMDKSLDLPSTAAVLAPYHSSKPAPVSSEKLRPPPKNPVNGLDMSSTATAAMAISPLKNAKSGPDKSSTGAAKAIIAPKTGDLPAYSDVANASNALAIVKSHGDDKLNPDGRQFSEAISFLTMLRKKLKEGVYQQFLDIMTEYKDGKCRPLEVSRRVTLLFHKNQQKDLVEEMHKWTPLQHRFYMPFAGCTR